jgi:hypothetical protein
MEGGAGQQCRLRDVQLKECTIEVERVTRRAETSRYGHVQAQAADAEQARRADPVELEVQR